MAGRWDRGHVPGPAILTKRDHLKREADSADGPHMPRGVGLDVPPRGLDGPDRRAPLRPRLRVAKEVPDACPGRVYPLANFDPTATGSRDEPCHA